MYNTRLIKEAIERYYNLYEENTPEDSSLSQDLEKEEPQSMLDDILQGKDPSIGEIIRSNVPTIYAFVTERIPNMIKIGYTDQGVYARLAQWQRHYKDAQLIGYWTATEFNIAHEKVYFKDYPVHKRTNNRGFAQITNDEKEVFKSLENNKDLLNMHVSSEFFHKYKNLSEDEKEELSSQIIEDIIQELKKDIRENNNLTDVKLYKLVGSGDSVKADTVWNEPKNFSMTALQQECIDNGVRAIANGDKDLLMAAVMRFGKTQATYHIINEAKIANEPINYVLVTSAKADVREAWRSDINHVDLYKKFAFIETTGKPNTYYVSMLDENSDNKVITSSERNAYMPNGQHLIEYLIEIGKTVIFFDTLQNLSGSLEESEYFDFNTGQELFEKQRYIKDKHEYLFKNPPQMIVIDETHYGSHSQTNGVITGLKAAAAEDEYSDEEIKQAKREVKDAQKYDNTITKIDAKVKLQCSGTPYYILQRGEFAPTLVGKTIISTVSFTDMVAARNEWEQTHDDSEQDKSPYFGVPNIIKFGMQLTKKCQKTLANESISTKMTELFKQDKDFEFVHKDAIIELMTAIFGKAGDSAIGFLNQKKIIDGEIFKHCILVLPRIDACNELKNLLIDNKIIDENERKVIVMVEKRTKKSEGGMKFDPDAKTVEQLNNELDKLERSGKRSLMLTVNRFLTGVSIPKADSMIYMKSTKSPQEYDQAIFRLCTRNVIDDGAGGKVNLKPNVYLIDFDINRMFDMVIKSAAAQNDAKQSDNIEDVKETIKQQLETIPIYAEEHALDNPEHVLGKMHQINDKDLMKLYVNYNKDKDIESSVKDIFDNNGFNSFISNIGNIGLVKNFEEGDFQRKGLEQGNGKDNVDIDEYDGREKEVDAKEKKEGKVSKEDKKIQEEIKARLMGMLKNILYCNICLDEPAKDLKEFMYKIDKDEENREIAKNFKLDNKEVKKIYDALNFQEKSNINILLYSLYILMNDQNLKPVERALNALNKLGRLDDKKNNKGEVALVVTPPELVKKMIGKVDREVFMNAENILEVNSKTGEFVVEIYKQFGKDVAEKVKIVPGDLRCKAFIKKVLNLLGISEYNIIETKDLNGDGKYDVKDFLEIKNEDLLSMNSGKKFDVVLQNPPYGSKKTGGDKNLHYTFTQKCLAISDVVVSVMPHRVIYSSSKDYDNIKKSFDNRLLSVEEYSGKTFSETHMADVGIFYFNQNNNNFIEINCDNKKYNVNSLFELSVFNQYEQSFMKYIENKNELNYNAYRPIGIDKKENIVQFTNNYCKRFNENCYFLTTNLANGGMNAKFISGNAGHILSSIEDLKNEIFKTKGSAKVIMKFTSKKAAENCKIALQNSLLRFGLHKLQDDQNMTARVYKYVPDIDWEDPRVLRDEGLLEVCGCPKDKCKEYAEYCRKYIEENVDKKKTDKD